jgi:hypothetical protein
MLNCEPESVELWCWCERPDDNDESTEVYCCRSRFASAGGGVRARFRGEAWNDWNCEPRANALGGTEVREAACGD